MRHPRPLRPATCALALLGLVLLGVGGAPKASAQEPAATTPGPDGATGTGPAEGAGDDDEAAGPGEGDPAEPPADPDVADLPDGAIVEKDGNFYQVEGGRLVAIGSLEAGEDPYETTLTGSRVDSSTNPVIHTDSVSEDTIRESGARTMGEMLQRVAGLQVTDSVGTGQQVTIDGVDSKYVLILIDGRPVNGQTNDRVDLGRLPVVASDIKRIEVVRGPMSALYGSEAMGGVINIITKRPKSGLHGEVEYGFRLLREGLQRNMLDASLSGGTPGVLFSISGSGQIARSTDRGGLVGNIIEDNKPDGVSDLPDVRQGTLNANLTLYPYSTWKLQTWGRLMYHELETKLSRALPLRDSTRDLQFQMGSMLEIDVTEGHTLTFDLRIDRYLHRYAKLPNGAEDAPPPFCEDPAENTVLGLVPDGFRFRYLDPECPAATRVRTLATQDDSRLDLRYTGELASGLFLVEQLKVSAGLLLYRQLWDRRDGDLNDTLEGSPGRTAGALYGEVNYQPFGFLTLLPGVRLDAFYEDNTDPGAELGKALQGDIDWFNQGTGARLPFAVGPRMSARLDLIYGLALRGSFGTGFRLPSFQEQFLDFPHVELGYAVRGNPDLRPENSVGTRAELVWSSQWLSLGAEGYLNLFQNQISVVPTDELFEGAVVYTYENLDRATVAGVNLRASLPEIYGFSADATYQYLFMANDTSGCSDDDLVQAYFCGVGQNGQGAQPLLLRPQHAAHIGARYTEKLTDTSLFTMMDFLSERQIDETRKAPASFRLTVGLRQMVLDHGELVLTLDNLLDSYHPVYGPKPGRSAQALFRAWF